MVIAALRDNAYNVVLLLHIVAIIAAFAPAAVSPVTIARVKKAEGDAGAQRIAGYFATNAKTIHFPALVLAGVFGGMLIGFSDEAWQFDQTWIWLAIVLYVVGIGVSHGVLFPNARRMKDLAAEMVAAGPPPADAPPGPPPQVAEMERRGKTLGIASSFLHLLLVVILVLMIWKPGA